MEGAKYWYSNTNPFYPSGYGLPNCTCYAWGRFWEISEQSGQPHVPTLPSSNGGEWWDDVSGYEKGGEPKLGAVACYSQPGQAGHVAIVEEIDAEGNCRMSNSGYSRDPGGVDDPQYFFMSTNPKQNGYLAEWQISGGYVFQGFIYNPYACASVTPPTPSKKKEMPLYFYNFL